MAKKSKSKQGKHGGALVGAGLIAAAAGAYFLYGSKAAAKHRKRVRGWSLRAKGEVLEQLEMMKVDSETQYRSVVDKVMKKYMQIKSIDPTEVKALGSDLKRHWKSLRADLSKASKVSKKIVKKAVRN